MRNTVRTFIAVEIPWEVRERARQLIGRLSVTPANVRWVNPDQLHWTLKFLGELDLTDVADVCRSVERAVAPLVPFDVEAYGAGAFPNPHHPRTIWFGMREGAEAMIELHGAIERELTKLGFRAEQRRFRPHVTLGRVRGTDHGMRELGNLIDQNTEFDAGLSTVYEVVVFASKLGREGPTYEPLGHAGLEGK